MTFIQIIEIQGEDPDPFLAENEEWHAATEGKRTLRRQIFARDRNAPDRYLALAVFDSHESAMDNSELPETQASAARIREMATSVAFRDLDVLVDRS